MYNEDGLSLFGGKSGGGPTKINAEPLTKATLCYNFAIRKRNECMNCCVNALSTTPNRHHHYIVAGKMKILSTLM